MTLKIMIEKFVTIFIASQDIAPRSRITYKNALARFFEWYKTEKFDTPKREIILLYKYWLDNQKLSAFTKATYLVVVKRFFMWAEQENICQNITRGIKGIKRQLKNHQKDSLSHEQIIKLLHTIKKDTSLQGIRDFAMINMLIRTGIRLKELTSAVCGDIQKTAQGQTILYVHGKGRSGKDEFVILTEEVLKPLQEYLNMLSLDQHNDSPLFVSLSDRNYGKMITIQSLSRLIKNRLRRAKIDSKRITAHSLRHTFGVLAIKAGASLYEVQLAMRHTASSTTQLYLGDIERIKRLEGSPEKKISTLLQDI